jgi:hypothetical protein
MEEMYAFFAFPQTLLPSHQPNQRHHPVKLIHPDRKSPPMIMRGLYANIIYKLLIVATI